MKKEANDHSPTPEDGRAEKKREDEFLVQAVLLDEAADEQSAADQAAGSALEPPDGPAPRPQANEEAPEPGRLEQTGPPEAHDFSFAPDLESQLDPEAELQPAEPDCTAATVMAEAPSGAGEASVPDPEGGAVQPVSPQPEEAPPAAEEDSPVIRVFRPALASMWYMFFGVLLGPAIIYFERDPRGNQLLWLLLSFFFLALIIHRVSLQYTLSRDYIKIDSWWGLGREEKMPLAALSQVRRMQGFVGRLAGSAQLDLYSDQADEPGLIILGQKNYGQLALELEELAREARTRQRGYGAD